MKSSFAENGNASVVGSLYDAKGKLIKTYDYSGGKLIVSDLADGNYTLVTMGIIKVSVLFFHVNNLLYMGYIVFYCAKIVLFLKSHKRMVLNVCKKDNICKKIINFLF